MTDINPSPSWAAVRQLEIGEFALGGANGNMNEQAKSLAARSEFLKQRAAYQYNTMAEAIADIANIAANQNVNVVDSGLYYKATAGATSLTKSPYDPVNLAVNIATNKSNKHTDLAVSLRKIKTDNIYQPVLQDLTTLLSVANFVSAAQTITTSSNCAITSITASAANNKVGTLSISNGLGFEIKEWLFGGDTITGTEKKSNWIDYQPKSSDITNHTLNTDANGDYRVNITLSNYTGVIASSTDINVFDKSLTLKSVTQADLPNLAIPAISSHGGSSIQFKIPKYFLTENGYDASVIQNAFSLIESFIDNLQLKVKTSVRKTATNSLLYTLLPKDTYSVTITDLTASFYLSEVLSKQLIKTLPSPTRSVYTTSVINPLAESRTNSPIALKVKFERGEVTSDRQLVVTDEDGVIYDAQFAPEYCVNFKDYMSDGYYSDGSFRTGTVYIIGNLASNEEKSFKIHVYAEYVNPKYQTTIVTDPANANFDLLTMFNGDLKLSYSKPNFTSKLLNAVETKTGSKFDFSEDMRLKVALVSNPALTSTTIVGGDRTQSVTRSGGVFVDFEVEMQNSAIESITANSIRIYKVYRIFKNGFIRLYTYVTALKDLPLKSLYGVQQVIQNATQITNFSAPNASALYVIGSDSAVMTLNKCYGDIHREGIGFGATRPPLANMTQAGAAHTFRFGWNDAVGSQSSDLWIVEKGHSWFTEVDFHINPSSTDYTTLLNSINNETTGFATRGMKGLSQVRNDVLNKTYQWCISAKDFTHEKIYTVYSNQYRLFSTTLMQGKIENKDNFTEVYNAFRDSMIVNWGVDYVTNYALAYNSILTSPNGKYFRMQYEGRLSLIAIQWLYIEAIKRADTAKATNLKNIIANIVPLMRDFAMTHGGIGISPAVAPTGYNPNSTASGMRYLALAIYMGLDIDGSLRTAFDLCESNLVSPAYWMRNPNNMLDDKLSRTANGQYLHYALYAESMYLQACLLLNKTPNHDVSQLALQGFNANGAAKDIEFCISESRRGIRNTSTFAVSCLSNEKQVGRLIAADKILDKLIDDYGWTDDSEPNRVEGFYYSLNPAKNEVKIGIDMSFTINTLSDVWLARYYGLSV